MNVTHINPTTGTSGPEGNVGQATARSVVKTTPAQEILDQSSGKAENRGSTTSVEEAKEMADALNETMSDLGTNLGFNVLEEMDNRVIVEIKNTSTDELIRQIPSEEMLKIMEKMEELSGLIFDSTI